jgi:hypothetical protein
MDRLIEVYDLCYSQTANLATGTTESSVSIATLWNRPKPSVVPSDCVVVARIIPESVANEVCE